MQKVKTLSEKMLSETNNGWYALEPFMAGDDEERQGLETLLPRLTRRIVMSGFAFCNIITTNFIR